jgi:hypothetical protein
MGKGEKGLCVGAMRCCQGDSTYHLESSESALSGAFQIKSPYGAQLLTSMSLGSVLANQGLAVKTNPFHFGGHQIREIVGHTNHRPESTIRSPHSHHSHGNSHREKA